MAAVASMASLFGCPCMSQIASVTRGVLRIRLTFHDFPWVIISRRLPSLAAQIGVGLRTAVLGERGEQDILGLGDICEVRSHRASLETFEVALDFRQHLAARRGQTVCAVTRTAPRG